jgi:hypothetical protein
MPPTHREYFGLNFSESALLFYRMLFQGSGFSLDGGMLFKASSYAFSSTFFFAGFCVC